MSLMTQPQRQLIRMTEELERTTRVNYLFDFYHSLLTEKQRAYVELYYLEDYSFSEIADTLKVTRQAVYDNLKRTKDLLEDYEANLGLYGAFIKRQQYYRQIREYIKNQDFNKIDAVINELETLEEE
ncbi:putative DNA-binding protein [Salinicoccus halitifaciens]|nr:putative DNA-binding protein [Salinicoccus halitifaciens]